MPQMTWERLISKKRFDEQTLEHATDESVRGEFQRDYDRLVFSTPFRRLQNKTQVMPMPESDFVHNRLTHSLETSCVGRSLGRMVGKVLLERHPEIQTSPNRMLESDFGDMVAAACLTHDIGNPPFGHSGEDAISSFFRSPEAAGFLQDLTPAQILDLQNFEGNAAGFRILTHTHPGQSNGTCGMRLTYSTLATFTKYPRPSDAVVKGSKNASEKKYGFFQAEQAHFRKIAQELGMLPAGENAFHRHPMAFLVEAADDICYRIIDFEDGCRLGLIPFEQARELLRPLLNEQPGKVHSTTFYDWREQLGVWRAVIINKLIYECRSIFLDQEEAILNGTFDQSLINLVQQKAALDEIKKISIDRIYRNRPVLEIEAAGFEVLGGLLEAFLKAVFDPTAGRHRKYLDLVPDQFLSPQRQLSQDPYEKILNITDFISGLTDGSAIGLYRKIKGIELPKMY
ncbi:deoxyguanosinetriphosphate triphosphohydrolase [Rufibacter immobilis]|uniref:Deoxyguanosinetriphosphate triphosphohydrolase n=1 Tax=Rufibacter immobilis TaxID=1348778 RepID=A0A3M9N4T3_9BACT|nr:deoxyguanosinetriphosphate triphosphohydrolase [Rufibacter immobilis]RNI32405.1 deoxyguanosinetriphosphate triphosphohydrolase [Rufibacter immobilis]